MSHLVKQYFTQSNQFKLFNYLIAPVFFNIFSTLAFLLAILQTLFHGAGRLNEP